jgi:type II secretory pathway pseudopilin PulG
VSTLLTILAVIVAAVGAGLVGVFFGGRRERDRREAAARALGAELARVDQESEEQLKRDLKAIPPASKVVSPERRKQLLERWGPK